MKITKFSNRKNYSDKIKICPVCGHKLSFGLYSKKQIFKNAHFEIGGYIYNCPDCLKKCYYGNQGTLF